MQTLMVISLESALQSVAKLPAKPSFILGSSSSSRRLLLEATGANFSVASPDIDEKAIGDRTGDPRLLVRLVATAKADALTAKVGDSILLTGDQVVVFDGRIREKPRDVSECRAFVESYSGNKCTTVGAVCLTSSTNRVVGIDEASVYFDEIPSRVIDELMADHADVLMRCAGGLMVEHDLLQPYVKTIDGGLDSLMGLPTGLVADLVKEL